MFLVLSHILYLLGKRVYAICVSYANKSRTLSSDAVAENASSPQRPDDEPDEIDVTATSRTAMPIAKRTIKFTPPAYIQRYRMVVDILSNPKYQGKLRKVVDFGCAELDFFNHLKKVPGVQEILCVDVDRQLLEESKDKASPLIVDHLSQRSEPLVIEICEGSVTQPDKKLEKTDAVICIELIEHLYSDVLQQFPSNVFGYIKPKVVVITTPNADFNVLFPDFSGFRHPDHKFEWTRKEFQDWAQSIVDEYPSYSVTFRGICDGPAGTEELGSCTQMAVFHRNEESYKLNELLSTKKIQGVAELFKTVALYEYPYHIDTRSDEEKILDEATYYINFLSCKDMELNDIYLENVLFLMRKFSPPIETLKTILIDAGWRIKDTERGPVVIIPESSSLSDNSMNDIYSEDNDGALTNEENEWSFGNGSSTFANVETSFQNDNDVDEVWDEEPSIVIPQNHSIVQENSYLFDGEHFSTEYHVPEEYESDDEYETSAVTYSGRRSAKQRINNIEETYSVVPTEQEFSDNTTTVASDVTQATDLNASSVPAESIATSKDNSELIERKKSLFDNVMMQPSLSQKVDELYYSQHVLNSTFHESELLDEAIISINNFILSDKITKLPLGNDGIQGNKINFSEHTSPNYSKEGVSYNVEQRDISSTRNRGCESNDLENMGSLNFYNTFNRQPNSTSSPRLHKMSSSNIEQNNLEDEISSSDIILNMMKTFRGMLDTEDNLLKNSSEEPLDSDGAVIERINVCATSSSRDITDTSKYLQKSNMDCSSSNSTQQELRLEKEEFNTNNDSTCAELMQNTDKKFVGNTGDINIADNVQKIDTHLDSLLSKENIKHKEENACSLATTSIRKTDDIEAKAHLTNVMSDPARSNISEKSLNTSRLNSFQNDNKCPSPECANEILEDSFHSCKSNNDTNNAVQFTRKCDGNIGCDIKDSTSMDVNISGTSGLVHNNEAKLPSPICETPPDSLSHEIMDSGYPNSASAQDITPENDLSSIAQDHISDIESPSVAEAPRLGILEPVEVENGDLANNNRDDEGNNMMAVEANDIEGLQPLIDVLENLENENDIYMMENGFPMWLLRILDMGNPLDFDVQPRGNPRAAEEGDAIYMFVGHDEGFDSSSSENDSDVANNEMENDNECED